MMTNFNGLVTVLCNSWWLVEGVDATCHVMFLSFRHGPLINDIIDQS
jgi:hypothetical protein